MYGNRNLRHGCICGQCYKYSEIIKTKRLSAGGKNDDKSLAAEVNPSRIGQSSLNKPSQNSCATKIDLNTANSKQSNFGGKNGLSDITNTLQNVSNAKNNKPNSLKPAAVVEKSTKNKDGISPAAGTKEKKVTFAPKIIACADAPVARKRYFYTKSEDLRCVVAKYREERLLRKEKSALSGKVANEESSGICGEISKLKSFFQPLLSAGAQPVNGTGKGNTEDLPNSISIKENQSTQKPMIFNLEIPYQTVFGGVTDKSPTEIFCPEELPKEEAVGLPITKSATHGEIEQSVSFQQNQSESKDILIIKSTVTLGKESPISIETTVKSENISVKRDSVDNTSAGGIFKLEGDSPTVEKSNENSTAAMVISTEVFDKPQSSVSKEDLAVRRKSSVTMSIPVLEEKLISIFGTGNHSDQNKSGTSTNAPAYDENPEQAESASSGETQEEALPNEISVINVDVETSPQNPESSDMELTPCVKTKTTESPFEIGNLSPEILSNKKLPNEAVADEINKSQHTDHTSALRELAYPSPDSQAPDYLTLLAGRRSIGIQTAINQPQPPLILLPMVSLINAFRETDEYKNVLTYLFGTDIIDDELFDKVLNPMCWSLFIILVFVGLIVGMIRKLLYFFCDLF